jgi:DNA-binding NtrC family response regulator
LAVNRNIARERDLSRVLDQVAEHAMAIAGADRAYVLLATDDGGWEVHAQRDRLDAGHAEFSRSVASEVVESGQPVVTLSAGTDSRFRAAASVHALRVQSIACVPIRGLPPAERTIGALYVETRGRLNRRLESELDLLSAFADQAAIGIDHARLHEELWARAAELQRTNESLERAHAKLSEVLERRTEQLTEARASLRRVRAELRSRYGYGALVGQSPAMRRLYAVIDRVKETDVPVLLLGESGTGKEVVARTIHDGGPRARGPFVGINCGAIPANLLEAELFGHTRGAFTGADRDRKGILLEAQGGTVLLDEIGELPEKMQAALLRVLQEKAVRPLGASEEVPIDVRVIAATHRDLAALVRERKFREDLFYRLQVVNVDVPPLRDRAGDIPLLVDHFLTVFSARYDRPKKTVSRDAFARLSMQHWPGNVRQLENALLGAWLLSEGDEIQVSDLALPADGSPTRGSETVGPSRAIQPGANAETRKVSERQRILAALEASSWNRLRAAQLVGLPRRTFYRRLKEYGIL